MDMNRITDWNEFKRRWSIAGAVIGGGLAGLIVGALIGAAVPNSVLRPGVAPLILMIIGAIYFGRKRKRKVGDEKFPPVFKIS